MLLNIEATTNLLAQVVSPSTYLAVLMTPDGRVIAYSLHPTTFTATGTAEDGSDRAKTVAAIASGLWREESFEHTLPTASTFESMRKIPTLDAVCELGRLRINLIPPFLLVLVGKTDRVPIETLALKAQLLQDRLMEPFSNIC